MDAILTTRRRLLVAGGAAGLLGACGRGQDATLHLTGTTMASLYNLKLPRAALGGIRIEAIQDEVQRALDAVEQRMSMFRPDSELSRFNRAAASHPIALSDELMAVFATAREVSALARGAFDITVEPLVQAWGFGTEKRHSPPPAPPARSGVSWLDLQLDAQHRSAFKRADLQADLGGIAKGYGVDRAALAMEALGLRDYMIEAGGEVRTRGVNCAGRPWRIGIEEPDATPPRAYRAVPLSGLSMATSGDYRNYYESGGRRYCHEIDPASGAPIRHQLCSVSVVDGNCTRADALATALIVLGPEAGFSVAVRNGLAAYFIERRAPGRFEARATPAFAALSATAAA